jgi:hypothetical protein
MVLQNVRSFVLAICALILSGEILIAQSSPPPAYFVIRPVSQDFGSQYARPGEAGQPWPSGNFTDGTSSSGISVRSEFGRSAASIFLRLAHNGLDNNNWASIGGLDVYVLGPPGTPFQLEWNCTGHAKVNSTSGPFSSVFFQGCGDPSVHAQPGESKEKTTNEGPLTIKGVTSHTTTNPLYPGAIYSYAWGISHWITVQGSAEADWTVNVTVVPQDSAARLTLTLDRDDMVVPSNFTGPSPIQPTIVNLTVQVTDPNGQPLSNHEVLVQVASADATLGGHIHANPLPPKGDIVDFLTRPPTPTERCTTDSGVCRLSYVAPEISGDFTIIASLVATPSVSDTKTIKIGIRGLQPISGTNISLTGSFNQPRCNGIDLVESMHVQNHWGQSTLGLSINRIANDFFDTYHEPIRLNDVSLPRGGLFDIGNNWVTRPGHVSHRLGFNADIEWNVGAGSLCRPLTLSEREVLKRTILGVTGKLPVVEGDHYHLNRSD